MINYFEVLNVSENAEIEVIRSAYKALAKKYHPDNTKLPKDVAEQKMAIINEAYQTLLDESAKREYIIKLHCANNYEKKVCYEPKKSNDESEQKTNSDINSNFVNKGDGVSKLSSLISYLVLIVIIISTICCIMYFGPKLLVDAWCNIKDSMKQIISTFSS